MSVPNSQHASAWHRVMVFHCAALVILLLLLLLTPGSGFQHPVAQPVGDGNCNGTVSDHLRFGCEVNHTFAEEICCHNSMGAEPAWYFNSSYINLFSQLSHEEGSNVFYDPACPPGHPPVELFRAPVGRTFEQWEAESLEHGWPSFRKEEANADAMTIDKMYGEVRSICGTHLGHDIPDDKGDRFCIDLMCIAGPAPSNGNVRKIVSRLR